MKTTSLAIIILLTFTLSGCIGCKKEVTDPNGLPAATQEGKNTLGFLLNGQPWTPKGFSGTANLSIDFDSGINNGILGIVAYRTLSSADKTQFILGITDSANLKSAPFTVIIKKKSIGALSFSTKEYCDLNHNDTTIYQSGQISIVKLDRINRIIAGTFNGILYKQTCGDTIKITEGRFDLKF